MRIFGRVVRPKKFVSSPTPSGRGGSHVKGAGTIVGKFELHPLRETNLGVAYDKLFDSQEIPMSYNGHFSRADECKDIH